MGFFRRSLTAVIHLWYSSIKRETILNVFEKDDDWSKLELFILIQKKMVPFLNLRETANSRHSISGLRLNFFSFHQSSFCLRPLKGYVA